MACRAAEPPAPQPRRQARDEIGPVALGPGDDPSLGFLPSPFQMTISPLIGQMAALGLGNFFLTERGFIQICPVALAHLDTNPAVRSLPVLGSANWNCEMATLFFPDISKENSPAMLRLLDKGHIPDTFEAWSHKLSKRVSKHELSGGDSRTVIVDPHEFANYCRTMGIAHDAQALDRFAYDKGTAR
jgi:hypothetical protein